ncbi:MAG: type I DNA topoisomerase [Thermotogae bacterium]|nr:type I DNA topoisomerase [Thermotogota bacterium]
MKTKRQLVIVESPTKARSISKYLGKDFEVMACRGHIRDLPKSKFGVDIEHDFKPDFEVIKGKNKIIHALKEAVKDKDRVYIASDPDREGEAIAWHVADVLGIPADDDVRVTFNEITERAVKEAIKFPGAIDRKKVDAQFARRILDRIVGYKVSPLLWRTIQRGLSAGRVQSVALRLICDREREIGDFVSQEFWEFIGIVSPEKIEAELVKYNDMLVDKHYIATSSSQAAMVKNTLMHSEFRITSIKSVKKRISPPNPYITSTLQQDAATKLNFNPTKTMRIAQQLYEGVESSDGGSIALITYMRTDSVRISEQASNKAKDFITRTYGKEYSSIPRKKSKKSAFVQDAHEAIRPTYIDKTPDRVKAFLTGDQLKLYTLIWNRFIASRMASGINLIATVAIDSIDGKHRFIIRAKREEFDGFRKVWQIKVPKKEKQLKEIPSTFEVGRKIEFEDIKTLQKFTQPPSRYTVASLIKKLEVDGLGRPSTYATIFNTLKTRGYISQNVRQLRPTVLGIVVNEFLIRKFPKLIRVKFTSEMESELDGIEKGNISHTAVLKKFYHEFDRVFSDVERSITTGTLERIGIQTDYLCPECGTPMILRYGRYGSYLHCDKCEKNVNVSPTLTPGIKDKHILIKDIMMSSNEEIEEKMGRKCPKCGGDLVIRKGKYGKFIGCSNYPKCNYTERYQDKIGVRCPKEGCDGEIVRRQSKKGKVYYICTNNPKSCDFISWDKPTNERCPVCGDVLYEKKGKLYCKTCKKWFKREQK